MAAVPTSPRPAAVGQKHKRTEAENDYQRFIRSATPEEKAQHKKLKADGSRAQASFRLEMQQLKVKNAKGTMSKKSAETSTVKKTKRYKNFWAMVQDEGGLIDKDFAIGICKNIAEACQIWYTKHKR